MRRRLEAAGGACDMESSVGRGTRVTFRLQLETSEPTADIGRGRRKTEKSNP
jgi:signal transduction histidine kinase